MNFLPSRSVPPPPPSLPFQKANPPIRKSHKTVRILPTSPKLRKLQSADFALFASSWWPNATSSNLRILTYLMIWLFVWDDDLDQTGGNLSTDLEAATAYRRASIAFLERCLGFANQATAGPPEAPSAIVESFRECADVLKEAYTEGRVHSCVET